MEYHNTNTIDIPIPSETSELIRIPKGVDSIPEHHYGDCDCLELIRIPNTVQKLETTLLEDVLVYKWFTFQKAWKLLELDVSGTVSI